MRKGNKIIITIIMLMVLSAALYLCRGYFLTGRTDRGGGKGAVEPTPEPVTPAPTVTPTAPPATPPATTKPTAEPTPVPAVTPDPTTQPEETTQKEKNMVVGYLKIEGTSIDYSVVQSYDNEFYLDHDINNNKSSAGWIFMDYENDIDKEDYNIVIYGHNMKSNTMFHSLRYYVSEDYFKEHRYITFNTTNNNYTWEVFSFYKTNVNFPYTQVIYPSKEIFYALASQMKKKSLYETGVNITSDDRILTLSTCTNESDDTRYVLHARLITP